MRELIKTYDIVSPKSLYICPICGLEHDDISDCYECITGHRLPKSLEGHTGFCEVNNCPSIVFVKLSDGSTAKFVLMEVAASEAI